MNKKTEEKKSNKKLGMFLKILEEVGSLTLASSVPLILVGSLINFFDSGSIDALGWICFVYAFVWTYALIAFSLYKLYWFARNKFSKNKTL